MLIGSVIIYAIGVPWLKVAIDVSWAEAVALGLTPFLLWDTAKLVVARRALPGRLVAGRSAARRPLAAQASSRAACRLRYESRSRRATSGQ